MNEQGVGVICDQQANFVRLKINKHDVTIDSIGRQLFNPYTEKWASYVTLTPDGKYILFLAGDRLLCMRRYSDNKLLAQYTVYDPVCSLAVSTNSRYVIVGTNDKRLLTLVIADPDEREHDERIAYVRDMNPGLRLDQAMALIGEVNTFDGEDSDVSYDSSESSPSNELASPINAMACSMLRPGFMARTYAMRSSCSRSSGSAITSVSKRLSRVATMTYQLLAEIASRATES